MLVRGLAPVALALLVIAPAALVALPLADSSSDPAHEELPTEAPMGALVGATTARIHEIRAPLLTAPAFTVSGGAFAAELEISSETLLHGAILRRVTDRATGAGEACAVSWVEHDPGASRLWADAPDLRVRHLTFTIHGPCDPGLYDLTVTFSHPVTNAMRSDTQPNAVVLMDPARHAALASGAEAPRFVVMADPQVADPRAGENAFYDATDARNPGPIARMGDGLMGDGTDGESGRWKAIRQAFIQAAEEKPDFVLIAGDLGFGQMIPGSYVVEYEEIWRLLVAADIPVYVAMGNHDGYVASGQDGYAYWRAYLGPLYSFAETVPGTWLLNVNTYDWSEMDRIGVSVGVTAWGGQVRETQMAWIRDTLAGFRAEHPNARVIGLAHHSPSWRQDPYFDADPSGMTRRLDGVPVLEQVSRGAVSFTTTDQSWSGRGRLELRDLLREHRVEVHFAGHTHRDRVARDDGHGQIVETHQEMWGMPEGYDPRDLHYFTRDDKLIPGYTQAELKDLVRHAPGPFYVETTTVMSGTTQYWGYRPVQIAYTARGTLDLAKFGVPMTEALLQEIAAKPELFNPDHWELGLFSKPLSFETGAPWGHVPDAGN